MIKILTEEPVAYDTNKDENKYEVWIYKNPTKEEIEEIKAPGYRILTIGNDYYLCSSYYYNHNMMAKLLYDYNKKQYKDYEASFRTRPNENKLLLCDISCTTPEIMRKSLKILIKFIPRFMEIGIINEDMVVEDYLEKLKKITIKYLMVGVFND